jgi:hypothetical protein
VAEGRVRGSIAAIATVAIAHFLFSIITTQSVSPDYILFWGVKAVRFAMAGGIDASYLMGRFPPPRVDYPPLVPIVQAWGLLFVRKMPWITGAAMSAAWLIAPIPVIRWCLAKKTEFSNEATAFWAASMAASLAMSGSGGNAEAMLVAYISIGAAAIIAEQRWIVVVAFAGAALTKEESFVTIGAILIALGIRELFTRNWRGLANTFLYGLAAAAGAGLWFFYQWRFGMKAGYHRFEFFRYHFENLPTMLREAPRTLAAGSWGLSWLIPLGIVIYIATRTPRKLIELAPLLLPLPIIFLFFIHLYLQFERDLAMWMFWTLPRLAQPALSLLILGAAFGSGDRMRAP